MNKKNIINAVFVVSLILSHSAVASSGKKKDPENAPSSPMIVLMMSWFNLNEQNND
ncbi:hypothetical protein KIH87_11315 [Paraneptunicella aestuarii]|uniref:hypothetical protein n=1 Tax=Paraneptunicella aestuarii TaxID=2831148 RepID=UPI001E36AD4F|nr:hypothetical protein [Paraneptunicella aestuarii]UAA37316.1 hypothetical protein KIH87_11315 [Paraneptunicella aestuarii]